MLNFKSSNSDKFSLFLYFLNWKYYSKKQMYDNLICYLLNIKWFTVFSQQLILNSIVHWFSIQKSQKYSIKKLTNQIELFIQQ